MGGAGSGSGCKAVFPPSSSMADLVVQLVAADHGAVQGCSSADEPSYKGHQVAIGDRLQHLHQGFLVQPMLTKEVHGGALSHVDFPPVIAGHLLDLLLQPLEQSTATTHRLCTPSPVRSTLGMQEMLSHTGPGAQRCIYVCLRARTPAYSCWAVLPSSTSTQSAKFNCSITLVVAKPILKPMFSI